MDKVFIRGLEFPAILGIYDWERTQPQTVRLDLEMAYDNRKAAESGNIADALDYACVAEFVHCLAEEGKFQLAETLAEVVATQVAGRFGVSRIKVSVTKPDALAEAAGVGVEIEREYGV